MSRLLVVDQTKNVAACRFAVSYQVRAVDFYTLFIKVIPLLTKLHPNINIQKHKFMI